MALKKNSKRKRPEPTLTYWRGEKYTQGQLAAAVHKTTEYLCEKCAVLPSLIGDNPFADLRYPSGLARALEHLSEAETVLDLVLLCLNEDDEKKDEKKDEGKKEEGKKDEGKKDEGEGKKKKTKAEEQEEEVDGWKKDFQKEYDGDKKNQEKQKFDGEKGYWDWIKTFFIKGALWYKGWLDQIDKLLEKVDEKKRKKIRDRLIELGKKIAKEWAKDGGKIKNTDLTKWGDDLQKAADNDPGDGSEIEKALDKIEGQVDEKLK